MASTIISGLPTQFSPTVFGTASALVGLIKPTGEPQRGYMFEVAIGPGPTATNATQSLVSSIIQNVESVVTGSNGPPNNPLQAFKYYAKSISIPASSVESIDDHFLGEHSSHPGMDSSSRVLNMTLWDDQNFTVLQYLQNWFNQLHTANGTLGRQLQKQDVMRDVTISLQDTSNLFTMATITLKNAFISNIGDIPLSYDDTNNIILNATFNYTYKVIGNIQSEQATS